MTETPARYEFRAFAQEFGIVDERIRTRAEEAGRCRESKELYLLSSGNRTLNTKVRDGQLDIKALVGEERRLEQWRPVLKQPFPLERAVLEEQVLAAHQITTAALGRERYALRQLLEEVIEPHPDVVAVHVYKQRITYKMGECIGELSAVRINGALMRTASIESADPDAVLALCSATGLAEYQNVNYLLGIQRVLGMAPLPQDAYYRFQT